MTGHAPSSQLTFHVPIVASNVSSIIIWLRFRIPFTFHVSRFTFGFRVDHHAKADKNVRAPVTHANNIEKI